MSTNTINKKQPPKSNGTPKPLHKIKNAGLPCVNIKRLNLYTATTLQVTNNTLSDDKLFSDKLRVLVSPLRSNILRKLSIPSVLKLDDGLRPKVSMCNARRCMCCPLLQAKSNISSSVNSRTFNCKFTKNIS